MEDFEDTFLAEIREKAQSFFAKTISFEDLSGVEAVFLKVRWVCLSGILMTSPGFSGKTTLVEEPSA
jgi:hypothetical protein